MAERAVLWERRGNVIRHRASERRGALPGSDVATVAGCGTQRVVVVHMARRAGGRRRGNVQPSQGKPGRAVIESCRGPTYRAMAYRTVRRRKLCTRRRVHGIIRLLPSRQMAARVTAVSRRGRQSVVAADVAQTASHCRVGIGQRETGCAVIEDSRSPSRNRVARRTLRRRDWESCRNVVRYVSAE